jgi:hypothetical protein
MNKVLLGIFLVTILVISCEKDEVVPKKYNLSDSVKTETKKTKVNKLKKRKLKLFKRRKYKAPKSWTQIYVSND